MLAGALEVPRNAIGPLRLMKKTDHHLLRNLCLLDCGHFELHPMGMATPDDEHHKTMLRCTIAIKFIRVKLVGVTPDKMELNQLCSNVSNAFVNVEFSLKACVPKLDMNLATGMA